MTLQWEVGVAGFGGGDDGGVLVVGGGCRFQWYVWGGGQEVGQAQRRSAWETCRGPKEIEFFRGKCCESFIEGWPCGLQKLEDWVFRSPPEWNEYIPKKIDTQKMYLKCQM